MNNERIILEMLDRIKVLEEEIDNMKKNFNIQKSDNTYISNPQSIVYNQGVKDSSKYIFNSTVYGKNRLVLNVVKEYVINNPHITVLELEKVFNYSLQGNRNYGVLKRKEEAMKIKDYKRRFFTDNEIRVIDGIVLVCSQWGIFNIDKFISRAKQLNFDIKKI